MPALNSPQWAADDVEWMLLGQGHDEVSRGDIQTEAAFHVPIDGVEEDQVHERAKLESQIDDCFDHLEYRARTFRKHYALRVRADVLTKTKSSSETDAQLVYRFLLACSRKELSQALGTTFTELCKLALHRFLGGRARVWNVDAGSADRRIIGTKTQEVAAFLEPHLGAALDKDMLAHLPRAGGDGGVDLVACISFSDCASGSFAVLGQCAASASPGYWRDKIYQPIRFKSLYRWTSAPTLALFIPFVYRSSTGAWLNEINVGEALVFDRQRILGCLALDKSPLTKALRRKLEASITSATKRAANRASKPAAKKKVSGKKVAPLKRASRKSVPAFVTN